MLMTRSQSKCTEEQKRCARRRISESKAKAQKRQGLTTAVVVSHYRGMKFPLDLEEVSKPCVTMSVIFPAYNEEGNIRRTVEAAVKVLPKVAMSWEIIVVDDGSSDATIAICDDLRARYPEVEVISHGQNRGYGAALKSGIMAAKYDLIFFSDSDGQFDLRELQQLICWSEDYDIVAGYRAKRQDPLHRRINAVGWNVLVRLVLGIKIRDIDCAFKLFSIKCKSGALARWSIPKSLSKRHGSACAYTRSK
jgi:glycosyltransferase involved in cell wall biosynthesis